MFENVRLAFQGVWSHKMRSMLTMLGIIIGIAAIITIVSTIKGTNEQIKENLIGAGNNIVTVQLNKDGYQFDASWDKAPSTVRPITEQTRQELEKLDGVREVSLFRSRSLPILPITRTPSLLAASMAWIPIFSLPVATR